MFIMFMFSTSLTRRLKACIFLTLRGAGANGKSFLMELIRNMLGSVENGGYGYKMPIQYLTERERSSNQATPVIMPLKLFCLIHLWLARKVLFLNNYSALSENVNEYLTFYLRE